MPLYVHKDDPRLGRWREEATPAFSRVAANIVRRAYQAERTADDAWRDRHNQR